ncbi:FecR domain-containing protein [Brasilonema sp. CT11]|nr:FecR domain-containing protein [Brasilonema sp. CT11]
MFRKFFLLIIISFWGVVVLPVPKQANATTPLTAAVIQDLRNLVQLMPYKNSKRPARKSDSMTPGDRLSTGRSALADLRFNDGSLARIGEQAVFQFLPQRRNFRLDDGTVVLLIPPGRGQTRISTPNAAAAIRGSALFVRYDPETETTIVGALTNSGIQVSNKDASRKQELKAGQLIVLVKGELKGLYDFDLRTFYQTSTLVRDLNLTLKNGIPSSDLAIASVQAETAAAVAAQSPLTGQDVVENPPFIKPTTSPDLPSNNITRDNSPVNSFLETGEVVPNAVSSPPSKPTRSTPTDPVTQPTNPPTTTTSPIVTPPVTVTQPPVPVTPATPTQPTVTQPSVPVVTPVTPTLPTVTQPSVPVVTPVTPTLPTVTQPSVPVVIPVTQPTVPVTQPTQTVPQPASPSSVPTPTTPTVPQPASPSSVPTPTTPTVPSTTPVRPST